MKNSNQNTSSGGVGFVGLLTILFIGLKLTGFITWSWWAVLSPIWVTLLIVLLLVIFIAVLSLAAKK